MKKLIAVVIFFGLFKGLWAQSDNPCGFRKGLQVGTCKFFYENGQLKEVSNWDDGKLDGSSLGYFENGKPKWKGDNKKGARNGKWEFFNESGLLTAEEYYKYKDRMEIKEGSFKYYYPNGKLNQVTIYKDNSRQGISTFYHENGTLKEVSNYKDDLLVGDVQFFYEENGKLSSKGKLNKEGKGIGTWRFFYNDGTTLETVGDYDNYVMVGKWQSFYKNGKLKAESFYINGKREGIRKLYKEDGSLEKTETYKDGVLISG